MEYKQIENYIIMEGIGYCVSQEKPNVKEMKKLCLKWNLPAFGWINYEGNRIIPFVYVQSTGILVKETACGSGSIAFSIYKGISKVQQTTGMYIEIQKDQNKFKISANVKELTL